MKVVIDTQVLLRSVPKNAPEKIIYHAFERKEFTWVFSNEIVSEYAELVSKWYGIETMSFMLSILLESENHQRFDPSSMHARVHCLNKKYYTLKGVFIRKYLYLYPIRYYNYESNQ